MRQYSASYNCLHPLDRTNSGSRSPPMLRRCAAKVPRQPAEYRIYSLTDFRPTSLRTSSSSTERARKAHRAEGASKLKPWHKAFIIGAGAGLLAGQGYLYYYRRAQNDSFNTYSLIAKEPVSSTASIFHLKPRDPSQQQEKYAEAWSKGVWNVQFKQPQIQIVRAYTPLPPLSTEEEKDDKNFRFLIRHDPHGEVSSYLHRLPLGSDIELRGPNIEYELTPDVQQVVFFAGGTGIAPALQIAHAMFSPKENKRTSPDESINKRKLHILWANRRREDCLGGVSDAPVSEPAPPKPTWSGLFTKQKEKPVVQISEQKGPIVQELEDLKQKYPGQITVEYFVNTEGTWIDEDVVLRSLSRFDDKDFSSGYATPQQKRQILISGPSGFISYLAGPKEWRNGREDQGPVGKIIAHAIAQNPHHVKVWKI